MDGPQVPAGEVYAAHESPNGELGFYSSAPAAASHTRCTSARRASCTWAACTRMLEGYQLADIVPTFGSINMIGGECDR